MTFTTENTENGNGLFFLKKEEAFFLSVLSVFSVVKAVLEFRRYSPGICDLPVRINWTSGMPAGQTYAQHPHSQQADK